MVAHAGAGRRNVRANGRPPRQDKWWLSEVGPPYPTFRPP